MQAEERLTGLWITLCKFFIYNNKLLIDKEELEDSGLTAWHFTTDGTLFIEDNDNLGIVYSYAVEKDILQITPEGGGKFGYSGSYNYHICNGEATLSRQSATPYYLWSGNQQSRETERFILMRYRGKDCNYWKMKDLHYQKAISEGAIPIEMELKEKYLLEDERRFLERLCIDIGVYIEELEEDDEE